MLIFTPLPNARLSVGLALQTPKIAQKFLRITHVFSSCVYAMWVGDPEGARYAHRPRRFEFDEIERMARAPGATWGRLALPPAFLATTEAEVETQWKLIGPLVDAFESEGNLIRSNFTLLITTRADEMNASLTTVRRTVIRYYYFGGTTRALADLPPGVKPGKGGYEAPAGTEETPQSAKRRGPQAKVSEELGKNEFIVREEDIADMVGVHRRRNSNGKSSTFDASHVAYLSSAFRRRHSDWHARYVAKKCVEPVSRRQLYYYWHTRSVRDKNPPERDESLSALGPGEIYEIDATGGRIYLVAKVKRGDVVEFIHLGKPWIYVLIDRWSRYVPAIYLTLNSPSTEEAKQVLLIAFTSRERRFASLRVNVDDKSWPPGVLCAVLCCDRGSDFQSEEFQNSVVDYLRIDMATLPPLHPDAKAIVERFIGALKKAMAGKELSGVFADRPLDPKTKKAAREAEAATTDSLADAVRAAIEVVDWHNHRPHAGLKKLKELTQAGVKPIPIAAYQWGLQNKTGLRRPPLTDEDYLHIMLRDDSATLRGGVLDYRKLIFKPANAAARKLVDQHGPKSRRINVKVDRSDPHEILVPSRQQDWPLFRLTESSARSLAGRALEEDEVLSSVAGIINAQTQHEFTRAEVAAASQPAKRGSKKSTRQAKVALDADGKRSVRAKESQALKRSLHGKPVEEGVGEIEQKARPEEAWEARDREERATLIASIAQSTSRRR